MTRAAALLACAASGLIAPAGATSVDERSLGELVCEADHALVATVINVDMVDEQGRAIRNRSASTGPHSSDRIRLHLLVESALFTDLVEVPQRVLLSHWPAWHYRLGDVQDGSLGESGIFLLKGERLEWVYPAYFWRELDERGQIEALRRRCKTQGAKPNPA